MRLPDENGYTPRIVHEMPRRIRIRSAGFHDPAFDAVYLEALLLNIPGVTHVRFNLKSASVVVGYNGEGACRGNILRCIAAIPEESYRTLAEREAAPDPVGTGVKGVLAFLTPTIPRPFRALLGWGLSLPVLAEGVETLLTRGVKVAVLDAAAVGFSLGRRDYFTATAIVALLALGEYLEQLSEDKTNGLLRSLLRPQVETIWVVRDGREIRLDPNEVRIGDHVMCGAGEMIPVDGVVVAGEASVNQSAVTGESVPVHLSPGEDALSGSVVGEGRLQIEAREVGSETGLARVSRFLENSLRFKSQTQKQSDDLADRLVPTTLALGVGLYLLTRDVRRAAAVLTVDYSCAIKLANPVAVKTAMFTAAHNGVLLKGSQALDALARVDTVVFDKTGTLTRGLLEVTDVIPTGGMSAEALLSLAAAAEEHYAHPVAQAVVKAAANHGLELPPTGQVDFIVAHGVSAYVNGERVLAGSHHFVGEDEEIDCKAARQLDRRLRKEGKNLLYVARNGVLEGVIALRDTLRPEAAQALRELKALGIKRTVMLTGDHPATARAVAGELAALDEIHWDLKPEDKAAIVKSLQEEGCRIAFAGDGVNDAPALVTAEVGICMPGGSALAREAAQVVLLQEDLSALVTARQIALRTERTIKNCFRSAVGLNTLFLLLASIGRMPPVMAAVLHNANTVGILGYAALAGLGKPDGQSLGVD
jgi:heavy metal translocating P-type ATPase